MTTESTEITRRAIRREQAARETIIDKVEVAAMKAGRKLAEGLEATKAEVAGVWGEARKATGVQLALIGLLAVSLVASGFVEGLVDSWLK